MEKYMSLLKNHPLFQQIPEEILKSVLISSACYIKDLPAGKIICEPEQVISHAGILLDGMIDVIHPSASGHDTIVSRILPGGIFGESFSCANEINPFTEIRCAEFSVVLFIDLYQLLNLPGIPPGDQLQLTKNILSMLAKGNVWLNTKLQIVSQKTLREKMLAYFELLALQNQTQEFTLPFNRDQLASFLGAERSSLSRELSRMQEEGLITVNKREIMLHQK